MVDHYTFFLLFELLIFINPSVSFSMALDNLSRRMHGWYVFWNHRFVRICFNSLFRCTFLELHHFLSTFCNFVILISTSKEKSEARLIFFFIYVWIIGVCVSCCFSMPGCLWDFILVTQKFWQDASKYGFALIIIDLFIFIHWNFFSGWAFSSIIA